MNFIQKSLTSHLHCSQKGVHMNFLRSLGHHSRPWVIFILSVGLESNGVFYILLSRPFDKIDMTLGQDQ